MRPPHLIGGWRNKADGKYCLDISVVVRGRQNAALFGSEQKQSCIYHPVSGRCLEVAKVLAEFQTDLSARRLVGGSSPTIHNGHRTSPDRPRHKHAVVKSPVTARRKGAV
jgi:hypothetical protein